MSNAASPQPPEENLGNQFTSAIEWAKHRLPSLPSVHPGHVFLLGSVPFCLHAYRGYRTPLDPVVQDILKTNSKAIMDVTLAEEGIRRSIGSAVAMKALRVATSGSIGMFGMAFAIVFYASGCTSIDQGMTQTRHWAHIFRKKMDVTLGVRGRVDSDHPEYMITQGMTEEQELEHISRTYLPHDEDWESEVKTDSKSTQIPQNDS